MDWARVVECNPGLNAASWGRGSGPTSAVIRRFRGHNRDHFGALLGRNGTAIRPLLARKRPGIAPLAVPNKGVNGTKEGAVTGTNGTAGSE